MVARTGRGVFTASGAPRMLLPGISARPRRCTAGLPGGPAVQEWDVSAVGSHYMISNVGNGMVLDVRNCGIADGTTVRQWAQLDNTCQQWAQLDNTCQQWDIKP
jgi:hypothetical protein